MQGEYNLVTEPGKASKSMTFKWRFGKWVFVIKAKSKQQQRKTPIRPKEKYLQRLLRGTKSWEHLKNCKVGPAWMELSNQKGA